MLLAAVVGAAAQGRAALPAGSRMAEPTGRESTFDALKLHNMLMLHFVWRSLI